MLRKRGVMPEQKIDNTALEEAIEVFRADKEKDSYVKMMEILEKSIVIVPTMPPENISPEMEEQISEGKTVLLPERTKIVPCLLQKETGEKALPVFTAFDKIPPEKKSPGVIAMPFMSCVAMLMADPDKVSEIVVNPFTGIVILNRSILEIADKRRKVAGEISRGPVTKEQFRDIAHNKVSLSLLPKYLFEHKEEGFKKLQQEEGEFLLQFYEEIYPKGKRSGCRAKDFSLMTLNLSDTLQMTRLDLPEETNKKGLCYRVYAVWKRDTEEVFYYALENTKEGSMIARVMPDGRHEVVAPAPDNGAEIEAVMNLL